MEENEAERHRHGGSIPPGRTRLLCVQFACSTRVSVGSHRVLCRPLKTRLHEDAAPSPSPLVGPAGSSAFAHLSFTLKL